MFTSKELKEQRKAKKAEMRAMVAKAKAEKRNFTDDEATQFDALKAEIEGFEPQIQRAEYMEQIDAREAVEGNTGTTGTGWPRRPAPPR